MTNIILNSISSLLKSSENVKEDRVPMNWTPEDTHQFPSADLAWKTQCNGSVYNDLHSENQQLKERITKLQDSLGSGGCQCPNELLKKRIKR
eukprot:gb/GEZJ01012405.1/.p1 GENE.gb/GEZJ01012405.1/~~gb/GEZJ01012405.1/.p1  ORF type:complete len:101 (-),score=11.06 gb/GEZJ01012405.1/:39-314(-)